MYHRVIDALNIDDLKVRDRLINERLPLRSSLRRNMLAVFFGGFAAHVSLFMLAFIAFHYTFM